MNPTDSTSRGPGRIILSIILVLSLAVATVAVVYFKPWSKHDRFTTEIDEGGGSLTVDNLTVIVPRGALRKKAKLRVTPPVKPAMLASPLKEMGGTAYGFDITLDEGRITKLAKPLTLKISPKLFPGRSPEMIWLYSPEKTQPKKRSFERIPAAGSLTYQLHHLSPFIAIFPDVEAWVKTQVDAAGDIVEGAVNWAQDSVVPEGMNKRRPKDCLRQLKIDDTTVDLSSAMGGGWSNERSSPIHPCLKRRGVGYEVEIINNSVIYWSVLGSPKVKLTSSYDGFEAGLTKIVMRRLINPGKQYEYLARQGKITAKPSGMFNTRVQLEADLGAFHAEELVIVLSLITGFFGVDPGGLQRMLETGEMIDCLGDVVSISVGQGGGPVDVMGKMFSATLSKCGEVLAKEMGVTSSEAGAKKLEIITAIPKAAVGLIAGTDSIIRKYTSTPVEVSAVVARPVKCEFNPADHYHPPGGAVGVRVIRVACGGGYMAAQFADSIAPRHVYLLQRSGDLWEKRWANEGSADGPPCGVLPANVGRIVGC